MDEVFEVEYIEAFPENCYDRFVIGEKFWITLPDFVKENFTTLNLSSDRLIRYLEDYLFINKLPLPWGILFLNQDYPIADYLKANLGFSGIQLLTYEETQPFHKRNPNIVGILLVYQKKDLQELSTKDTVFNQFWQILECRAENIHLIYFPDRLPEEWLKERIPINFPEPLDIEIPPEFDIDDVDIFEIYF